MAEEINIVEIIKSRRYFQMALRLLLSKKQRLLLKSKSRYTEIDPDKDAQLPKGSSVTSKIGDIELYSSYESESYASVDKFEHKAASEDRQEDVEMSNRGIKEAFVYQSHGMLKQAEVEFVQPNDKLDLDQFIFDKSFQIPRESASVAYEEKKGETEKEMQEILQTYEDITD